jgi:hypothetical protein
MIYFFRLLIVEQPFPFGQPWKIIPTPAPPALIGWQRFGSNQCCASVFAGLKALETKKANLAAGLTR